MDLLHHPKVRSELIPSPPTYNTKYGYLSWESYHNTSYYTRILPPIPHDCPLPMGTKGKTSNFSDDARITQNYFFLSATGKPDLPDPKMFAERFFRRRKFRADPGGTNVMFAFMAQHFTHQFFHTDYNVRGGFTKALGHGVSCLRFNQKPGFNEVWASSIQLSWTGKLTSE